MEKKMQIKVNDKNGIENNYTVRFAYLVKFVDPEKDYPVKYTIKQDGTKINNPAILKGKDLTEPQIVDLFLNEHL